MEDENKQSKQDLIEKIKSAKNILVTTTKNPTIDQITAALGLSQVLHELDKRVTTLVSNPIPQKISFLETNDEFTDSVDSLRDFVISLDKRLADKLHYKVIDDEVRIFITPYQSSIKHDDIRFSQGGFNVDAVIILGATEVSQLEDIINEDAGVINTSPVTVLTVGKIPSAIRGENWHNPGASSLSEMVTDLVLSFDDPTLMTQSVSQALLTGIITATKHFSNEHTTPQSMNLAAKLMAHGANQQMIMSRIGDISNNPSSSEVAVKDIDDNLTLSVNSESQDDVPLAEQKGAIDNNGDSDASTIVLNDSDAHDKNPDLKTTDEIPVLDDSQGSSSEAPQEILASVPATPQQDTTENNVVQQEPALAVPVPQPPVFSPPVVPATIPSVAPPVYPPEPANAVDTNVDTLGLNDNLKINQPLVGGSAQTFEDNSLLPPVVAKSPAIEPLAPATSPAVSPLPMPAPLGQPNPNPVLAAPEQNYATEPSNNAILPPVLQRSPVVSHTFGTNETSPKIDTGLLDPNLIPSPLGQQPAGMIDAFQNQSTIPAIPPELNSNQAPFANNNTPFPPQT